MPKTDKAAEIAGWYFHQSMPENKSLCRRIRAAIKAERTRCVKLIMEYQRQQLRQPARHQAFVCDDIATLISTKPKKKARGKRV